MKRLLMPALFLAANAVYATCGDLEIKVENKSSHHCTFKNKVIYYGTLPSENIPAEIAAGQSSPFFIASQDGTGIGVLLTYTCDNEIVKFYSWQEYCGIVAGSVGGQPQDSTTLNLDYVTQTGSAIWGRPGRITWKIS